MTSDSESSAAAGDARSAGSPGPGALLRSARNARGLSRVEAAAALRLDESSIAALEEENFGWLGAPVFVRGHLRRYAELLGLPVQSVLDAYCAMVPHGEALPDLPRRVEVCIGGHSGARTWGVAGGVLLLTAVLVWAGSSSYQALSSPAVAAHPVARSPVSAPQETLSRPPAAVPLVVEDPVPEPAPVPERAPELLPGVQPAVPQEAAAPHAAAAAGVAATAAAPAAGDTRNVANGG